MSIPTMRAIVRFYRNCRARQLAALTVAEMDATVLKDIGIGEVPAWTLIDMGKGSRW